MDVNSDHIEIVQKIDEKVKSEITDLELEVKIEKTDETGKIKIEVFEEENNSEALQIIGEKRKSQERSDLENENKKIKEEFVIFEENLPSHVVIGIEESERKTSSTTPPDCALGQTKMKSENVRIFDRFVSTHLQKLFHDKIKF